MQRQIRSNYPLTTSWILPVAALLCVQYFGSREILEFTRTGIFEGEIWRMLSGHTIHVSWQHLGVNLAGLVFCQFLFSLPARHLLGLAFTAALVISSGLLLLTSYQYYLGLSGILHAWLIAGAIFALSSSRENTMRMISWAVIVLLLCKIGFEQFQTHTAGGASTMEQFIDAPIVTEAHWLGLVAGATYAVLLTLTGVSPILRRSST